MLLLEEIIVESDGDLEIVSTVAVGFDDDKNFVVPHLQLLHSNQIFSRKVWQNTCHTCYKSATFL